jgi:5-methylcytosine-specific restriction endonuclease McrA
MRSRPSRSFPTRSSTSFRVATAPTPVQLNVIVPDWKEQYGDNWRELSNACKERDNYQCQKCKNFFRPPFRHKYLNAHHIIPLSKNGPNNLANLQSLCHWCHKEEHGHVKS